MNIRDMFDNQYLAADDLRDREWTLTISKVVPGKLRKKDGKFDARPIVHFSELEAKATKDKPAMALVLNRTNAKTVKALYGKETRDWVGRRITIYPTTCDSFGKRDVPCIRVKDEEPPETKAKKPAPPQDEPNPDGPEPPDGALETDTTERVGAA